MELQNLPPSCLLGLKEASLLSMFPLDGKEYLIFQLDCQSTEIENLFKEVNQLQEVCRFKVKNTCCIVAKKIQQQNNPPIDLRAILSGRELQIATLVAMGCPNKQIANKLHISEWTVATHLRRIFAKLRVESRAAMIYQCATLIRNQCDA